MANTLIFGKGFLGTKYADACARRGKDVALVSTDIADAGAVRASLNEHMPTRVVNFAGKTGKPNVDWCETHKLETMRSNVVGALTLAAACAEADIHLTHVASGCIFYGDSPDPRGWRESDFGNPSAFYSRTKYAADLVLEQLPNVAIVRLRMPIDSEPGPRNLITKLAAYPRIVDVANSVTVVDDLFHALDAVTAKQATGIFHAVNPGVMRHRDLIALYEELVDPAHTNEWISPEELVTSGLAAKLRSNNIMQNTRLPELGVLLRPIEVALRECMVQYAAAVRVPEGRQFPTEAPTA